MNIEHRTSNIERRSPGRNLTSKLGVRCSVFDVRRSHIFDPSGPPQAGGEAETRHLKPFARPSPVPRQPPRRRLRPLLGTFVEIGALPDGHDVEAAITSAFDAVANVHRLLSFQNPDSDLSRLNGADGEEVVLHPLTIRVLRLARAMTRASGGYFNFTLGGALVRRGVLPHHGGPLPEVCGLANDLELQGNRARLRGRVCLTLDGIAKGFAVDLAILALRRCGITTGWVNAGGDIRAFGEITLPLFRRDEDGMLMPLGGLRNGALATSTIRAEFDPDAPGFVVAGKMGILAPGTWSVMARRAWRADALTKVAALAQDSERDALIKSLGGRLVQPINSNRGVKPLLPGM